MELPKTKIRASSQSPRNLIIFSKPKVGKTSLFAELEDALIMDLEKGSRFIDALKIEAESVEDILNIGKQIVADNYPYKYIIVDTMTTLEDLCIPYAETLYSRTSMGKNWFKKDSNGKLDPASGKAQYGNILNLPNGGGYMYLRQAVTKMVEYIKTLAPRTILSCHIKDVQLEKAGAEFTASDLDLTGKIKRIISSQSDAIGYLYRAKNGTQNILSFATSEAVACGARPAHLRNAEFVISEMTDKGLVTYWERVYID